MTSFITISWNAIYIGGFQPGDILLIPAAVAAAAFALHSRQGVKLSGGLVIGATLVGLAGVLTAFFPPSPQYLSGRYNEPTYGIPAPAGGNLTQLAKFEIALVVVIAVVGLLHPTFAERRRLANAWAISALISSSAALLDATHLTHINESLRGVLDTSGRQAGLSSQENHLALALVLAAPVIVSWLGSPRIRTKIAGACSLGVLTGGMLQSGSRGGFVVLILAVGLAALLAPGLRTIAKWVAIGLPLVLIALYVLDGSLFTAIAAQSRLAGGLGADSDYSRALLHNQGLLDFQTSPMYGIGFDYLTAAHEVHLQLLAAGGLIALMGYIVYWVSAVRLGLRAARADRVLAPLLVASLVSFLAINFVENQVADLYLYVPVALLSATPLMAAGRVARPETYLTDKRRARATTEAG